MKYNNSYSSITAWLGYLLSIYGGYFLYVEESFFWILIVFTVFITAMRLVLGITFLRMIFYSPFISHSFIAIVLYSIGLGYFVSSVYGLIKLIDNIGLNDNSIVILPFISITLILAGTSVGLYSTMDSKKT